MIPDRRSDYLVQRALKSGVESALVVPSFAIPVLDELADKCRPPGCRFYGLSRNCPPHSGGSGKMREKLLGFSHAIFLRLSIPEVLLNSKDCRKPFSKLHKICSSLEREATDIGFGQAEALAGGSCKDIFCHDHEDCPPMSGRGQCRYPDWARTSVSGYGIDVKQLVRNSGWSDLPGIAYIYGLVLLAG